MIIQNREEFDKEMERRGWNEDVYIPDSVAMDIFKATMPTRYNSLRDLRYKNGDLTQEEMAKRIGISKAAYCNIERGVRFGSVATWEKIQTLFNLTDDEVWKLIKKKNK